ncbi:MAG: CPBP family intramembrane metalloprotease [Lewinellaceae bacterium]|nr:CPBP family intramembrane metalloprotease [Lewinellaceae bacterium]
MEPSSENHASLLPPGIVLILLLVLVFLFLMIGQGLGLGLTYLAGLDLQSFLGGGEIETTIRERHILRGMAALNQLFTFWAPALVLAWFIYRRDWVRQLWLDRKPGLSWSLNGALWILGAFPLVQFIYWINKTAIPLPDWMRQLEDSTAGLLEALLVMDTPLEFLFSLFVMGFLPALGEELVFRGFLQRQLGRTRLGEHAAVWVAAAIFSAIHFQFEGFLPRFLLGALLGYLFYWTRNLWVPIIAHFANNAIQVIAAYYMQDEFLKFDQAPDNPISWPLTLASAIWVIGLGYLLWTRRVPPPENPAV